jgi:DNA-directed RNA polymerase III subunit RPC8
MSSNPQQEIWIWNFDDTRLHYDNNEIVRFQVTEEEWHDQAPGGPREETEENLTPPYRIKGTMAQEGLGVCLWWDS